MTTKQLDKAFLWKHYKNNYVNVPAGWAVQYDETRRGFDPIRDSLLEAIMVGVTELLGGAFITGMLDKCMGRFDQMDIPAILGERGGIASVTLDPETKIAFISGYMSAGTLADNPEPLAHIVFK